MAICKDPNDQIERNASLVTNLNVISPEGTLRPSFATTALEEYSSLVSADIGLNTQTNVINRFVNQYGQEAFDAGLTAINNTLINREVFQTNLPNYPALQDRLNTLLPITAIEYASYMDEFLQTPNTVVSLVNSNVPLAQSQLNDFYRKNFTQSAIGSFCALMPNIFGAIGGFFDLVEDLQQKFEDVVNLINNFSLEDIAKKLTMKNIINKIKEQVVKVVEDKINALKGVIENLSFDNIVGQIETFVNNNIIKRFSELKAQALAFFSKENVEKLKKKVENLINYAGSIFKEPTLEEIQFLVFRFCSFSGQIESALDLLKKPLDDFMNDYQNTFNVLKSFGRVNTSSAVSRGGAIRYSDEERKKKINIGNDKIYSRPLSPAKDLTTEELKDAGAISKFDAANSDSRFTLDVEPFQWEILAERNIEVIARLIRLQRIFGKKLTILSAYRSYESQKNIWVSTMSRIRGISAAEANNVLDGAIANGSNPGDISSRVALPSKSAPHISCRALDITWNGFNSSSAINFCRIAKYEAKFLGIGIYGSFIHVDIVSDRIYRDSLGIRDQILQSNAVNDLGPRISDAVNDLGPRIGDARGTSFGATVVPETVLAPIIANPSTGAGGSSGPL